MKRRTFIRKSCRALLILPLVTSLESCDSIYYVTNYKTENQKIVIPLSEFEMQKSEEIKYRKFILIKLDEQQFPICIFRISENEYTAALMECTHQGCELNVIGSIYACPCHGSEFSNRGKLLEGPAEYDLKTFQTITRNANLYVTVN